MAISPNFLLWLLGCSGGPSAASHEDRACRALHVADGPPGAWPYNVDLLVPPNAHPLKAVSMPFSRHLSVPAQGHCNLEDHGWHRTTCHPAASRVEGTLFFSFDIVLILF